MLGIITDEHSIKVELRQKLWDDIIARMEFE